MKDKKSLKILIIIGSLLGALSASGLCLLFIFKGILIDETKINLLEMYLKSSFALFGSLFSIGTSLFIFHLQDNKKHNEEILEKEKQFKFINRINNINAEEIKKLNTSISQKGIDTYLVDYKKDNQPFHEMLQVIYYSLDTNSTNSLVLQLDPNLEENRDEIERFNKTLNIKNLILILVENAKTDEGKERLIRNIYSSSEEILHSKTLS